MQKIMVAGIGTDVGKTVVSAVLVTLLQGNYWKPIQCGKEEDSDTVLLKNLVCSSKHHIFPPLYTFQAPLSPHHAARLEGVIICTDGIVPPISARPLVIEGVGGIFVPLSATLLSFDLFKNWNCPWIIVSKYYLGSINHTLLTMNALKQHGVSVAGLIFNGEPNPDSESVILHMTQVPFLGRLLPENEINSQIIYKYATQWKPYFQHLL